MAMSWKRKLNNDILYLQNQLEFLIHLQPARLETGRWEKIRRSRSLISNIKEEGQRLLRLLDRGADGMWTCAGQEE